MCIRLSQPLPTMRYLHQLHHDVQSKHLAHPACAAVHPSDARGCLVAGSLETSHHQDCRGHSDRDETECQHSSCISFHSHQSDIRMVALLPLGSHKTTPGS